MSNSTEPLSFEGVLDYSTLKLFIRFGRLFSALTFIGCFSFGLWAWKLTGSLFALVLGGAIGLFASLLVRVLVDMARVIADVLLPR